MPISMREFEARIRQLNALDHNAGEIYSSLIKLAPDPDTEMILKTMAREETEHVALSKAILMIVNSKEPSKP